MTDIVAAARAHIASLPPHLKDRYSAQLICNLIAKVLLLEELREQDGQVIGLQLREYQKMQERCIDGDSLTDEERKAFAWGLNWLTARFSMDDNPAAHKDIKTLRNLLERLT